MMEAADLLVPGIMAKHCQKPIVTAGIGINDTKRYIVNPKLFYYNPKYSINLITNFNNVGELPLTIQDYFKLTGGFKNMMAKGGSSFNVSSNDLGISLMRNNRAKEIETKFGATNFSYNVKANQIIHKKTEHKPVKQETKIASNKSDDNEWESF